MSAYVVDTAHIDYLVQAAIAYGQGGYMYIRGERTEYHNADMLGAVLLQENIASVMHRYPDCAVDDLPGPIPTQTVEGYTYREGGLPQITPVAVLKAISGYEYQSCEHPDWTSSAAYEFCQQLRAAAINKLPGYHDAAWEVRRGVKVAEVAPDPLDDFNYVGSRHHY